MSLLHTSEHLNCFNYGKSEHPDIEVIRFTEGETRDLVFDVNEIVFFLKGRIRFVCEDLSDHESRESMLAFLPAGKRCKMESLADSLVVVFRIKAAVRFCENLSLEKLFAENELKPGGDLPPAKQYFCGLEIKPPLWQFLDLLMNYIKDGIHCRSYYEMKTKELLFLLRIYYSKEDLYSFLLPILSRDALFSEYVRLRWQDYSSIKELAASMHLTHKQFYSRFLSVFGKTPRKWMSEGKAPIVFSEIVSSGKPFKQIAHENGFSSDVHLIRFCRRTLNATPTELRRKNLTV